MDFVDYSFVLNWNYLLELHILKERLALQFAMDFRKVVQCCECSHEVLLRQQDVSQGSVTQ